MKATYFFAVTALTLGFGSAYAQPRVNLQACLERASIDSAEYPQRVDKGTTIIGVGCRESAGRIIYSYENKLDVYKSDLTPEALRIQAKSIRTKLCTNPALIALLKLVDMEYIYYDAADVYIDSVVNRIEDCVQNPAAAVLALKSQSGSRWVTVSRRIDGKAVLEIDRTSLVRNGDVVRVWTRAVYDSEFSVGGSAAQARKVLALNEINCVKRTEKVHRIVFTGEDDQPIPMVEQGPYEAIDIAPDSSKENVMQAACSLSTIK